MATGKDMAETASKLGNGRADRTGGIHSGNCRADIHDLRDRSGDVALASTNSDGRVALADSAKRDKKYEPGDSVYLRLARAQDDVKTITQDSEVKMKTKEGGTFSYKGVSAAQIVTLAKRALLDNGIVFIPVADKDGVRIAGNKTSVWVDGHFISTDNKDDKFAAGTWGAGTDNNDKDCAKAMTNAIKIILSKVLMMSTLDDDAEEATPHEPTHNPRQVTDAEALTDVAIKTWADAYKAALDGCQTLAQLKKVRAENAHMMKSSGVPQVTKDYFTDKISALEGILQ